MAAVERAFVFADLSGYTALTEAHGDAHAASVARRLAFLAREAIGDDGEIVKTIGDAVMLALRDGASAIRAVSALCSQVDAEERFPGLRVGIHAGSAELDGGDYFGTAVNVAARVAAHAGLGQVLCTQSVVEAGADLVGVTFEPLGDVRFKNIATTVAIFEVILPMTLTHAFVDPVCRMRVGERDIKMRFEHEGRIHAFCSPECAERFRASPPSFM